MAKARRTDSKQAYRRQQSELKRQSRAKQFIGEGVELAQAEKRERIDLAREMAHAERIAETPLGALVVDFAKSSWRLMRALASAPKRIVGALLMPGSMRQHA